MAKNKNFGVGTKKNPSIIAVDDGNFNYNEKVIVNDNRFSGASEVNCAYKAFMETMTEDLIKTALFKSLENRTDIMYPDVPLKFRAGNNTAELIAEEQRRRAALQPPQIVPPGWRPPLQPTEEVKLRERFALYNDYWARLKTNDDFKALLQEREKDVNKGFESRFRVISGSDSFDTYSPIAHDFFQLNNHVAPNNRIVIRLTMHDDGFLLNTYLTQKRFKLELLDLKLHLHTIDRKERIVSPAIETYLMSETQMHKKLVASGASSANFRIHESGIMPKSIIIAMVTSQSAEGTYNENPFYFHHFFMKKICLYINGEQYPSGGIECDFTKPNNQVARLYRWMYENTGAAASSRGNIISWPAFQAGCTIIPFNLDPDKCNGIHFHNGERGVIDLEINFSIELSQPIYVLYELVYPKVVVNDKLNGNLDVLDIVAG